MGETSSPLKVLVVIAVQLEIAHPMLSSIKCIDSGGMLLSQSILVPGKGV